MEEEGLRKSGILIQGFDVIEMARFIARASKRKQATFLAALELEIDKESELYKKIRKLALDTFNDFSREVVSGIFGDIVY